MRHASRALLLATALCSHGLWAQTNSRNELSFWVGPNRITERTIGGTNVVTSGTTLACVATRLGYRLAGDSGVSLWLDTAPATFTTGHLSSANIPGSVNQSFMTVTAGLRVMAPVGRSVSVYGAGGGGGGIFQQSRIAALATPRVESDATYHGLVDFAGGVDVRVTSGLSVRGEVRDFVTGRRLSGSDGRHHVIPLVGFLFRFGRAR